MRLRCSEAVATSPFQTKTEKCTLMAHENNFICFLILEKLNFHKMSVFWAITPGTYLLKVKNRNTKTRCEICSKLTIKIPERSQLHFVLPFTLCSSVSIVNFEHVIDGWVGLYKLTSYDLEILVQLPKIP